MGGTSSSRHYETLGDFRAELRSQARKPGHGSAKLRRPVTALSVEFRFVRLPAQAAFRTLGTLDDEGSLDTPPFRPPRAQGGTALRKCRFADYRFPEDLDFALIQETRRASGAAIRLDRLDLSELVDPVLPAVDPLSTYSCAKIPRRAGRDARGR